MAQSVTLSSAGSAVLALNPVAKSTTLVLTVSSCAVATIQIDASVDDPSIPGGPASTWALLSSGAAMVSSNGLFITPLIYTVLTPIGQVRLVSTTNAAPAVFTLKALQSVTA